MWSSGQKEITCWYQECSKKVQIQSRRKEFQSSEQTRIYHNDIHKKTIKRKAILKLETEDEGLLEGHDDCSQYLQNKVQKLLENPAILDAYAQETLFSEVSIAITEDDNKMMETLPTKDELFKSISTSNLQAAAGSDGIPSLLYKECWGCLGDVLFNVILDLFISESPRLVTVGVQI